MTTRSIKSSLLIGLLLTLLGCSQNKGSSTEPMADLTQLSPAARVETLAQVKPSVQLNFAAKQQADDTIVEIWLENPEHKSIHSAEVWLTFNPKQVSIKDIQYSKAFPLPAPYQEVVDQSQGIIRLGAATLAEAKDARLKFAELTLTKQEGATFLDLYDPKKRASVNTLIDQVPYNLLQFNDSPALVLP